jgi:hypothetical protein
MTRLALATAVLLCLGCQSMPPASTVDQQLRQQLRDLQTLAFNVCLTQVKVQRQMLRSCVRSWGTCQRQTKPAAVPEPEREGPPFNKCLTPEPCAWAVTEYP